MRLFMGRNHEGYVDTSALISFRDSGDSYHLLFAQLFSTPPKLMTSSLVIAEGHAWFLRRYDSSRGLEFMRFVESSKMLEVLPIGSSEIIQATKYLQKFSDQDLTLVDAVGLYLMKKRGIKSCWSTDRHLSLTGVPLVIHQI